MTNFPPPLMVSEPGQTEARQTHDPACLINGRQGLIPLLTTNRDRTTGSDVARSAS